jgi:hypothetical protein
MRQTCSERKVTWDGHCSSHEYFSRSIPENRQLLLRRVFTAGDRIRSLTPTRRRFPLNEPLQGFDSERKFPRCRRPFFRGL